jgi:retron-type reverse transcriptase
VRAVSIPKLGGGVRVLGVPTIADRIAQTVVAGELEKVVEPIFHPDSYGYRPHRDALDAVGYAVSGVGRVTGRSRLISRVSSTRWIMP